MKNKIIPLTAALCLFVHFAQALVAQNATISFDLRLLTKDVFTSTIKASDGTTELTVTRKDANSDPAYIVSSGLTGLAFIDNGGYYTFTFNTAVTLKSSYISNYTIPFEQDESLSLQVGNGAWISEDILSKLSVAEHDFDNQITIPANTALNLRFNDPDGVDFFSWRTLTVTTVPEPATYALIFSGATLVFVMLRRRRR